MTFTRTAQFFPAADKIVILEDGGVKVQGSWEEIKQHASSSISKFSLQQHQAQAAVVSDKPPDRTRLEAQTDLARKAGDFGLYRQCSCKKSRKRRVSLVC